MALLPHNVRDHVAARENIDDMLGLFTLQMKLALRALQKDRANRVQIVVAAASQWPRSCLRHLQQN